MSKTSTLGSISFAFNNEKTIYNKDPERKEQRID